MIQVKRCNYITGNPSDVSYAVNKIVNFLEMEGRNPVLFCKPKKSSSGSTIKYLMDPKIEFNNIIDLYKIEKDTGTFKSKWNPYKLNTKKDFNSEIKRPGRGFVGDNIILSLLPYILGIDFIVFDNNFSIIDLSNPKLENKYYCILYSDNNVYKTIGLSKGDSIKTIFKKSKLPPELKLIIDRELLIISHMKHIKSSSLHDTLDDLSDRLKITLSRSDREFICTLINC